MKNEALLDVSQRLEGCADDWESAANFWEDVANIWGSAANFWEDAAKVWEDAANFWERSKRKPPHPEKKQVAAVYGIEKKCLFAPIW